MRDGSYVIIASVACAQLHVQSRHRTGRMKVARFPLVCCFPVFALCAYESCKTTFGAHNNTNNDFCSFFNLRCRVWEANYPALVTPLLRSYGKTIFSFSLW